MSDVKQRFLESITYLRKLGFFEEHSDLTSEDILEKLKEKEGWSWERLGKDWMSRSV